MHFADI